MQGGRAFALMVAVATFAGCVAPMPTPPAGPVGTQAVLWETLSDTIATPPDAPRRSAAERTGDVVARGAPQFAAFDEVVRAFMASHEVPAATVAVLRDGKLRYENGYGFLDEEGTKPTPPDAMFRIASVTKPATAAVVTMLVDQGRIGWEDPVFCLAPDPAPRCILTIEPHPARPVGDVRLADLQLRHLVEHQTGWTRGPCTVPVIDPITVAAELGVATPPPAWRLAQWFLGTPMEYAPGTNPNEGRLPHEPELDRYCNMGYLLLGLAAEAATNTTLAALYASFLFQPLEVAGDIEPGHTLLTLRNPREPFYACDGGQTPSIYDPSQKVCWADGGFDLDAGLAPGGLVSTAAATAAVYEVFANDGSVRDPDGGIHRSGHGGNLPGTETLAWRFHEGEAGVVGDVVVVILFNKSVGREGLPDETDLIDPFQDLYAELLAAYAGAEAGTAAARAPGGGERRGGLAG